MEKFDFVDKLKNKGIMFHPTQEALKGIAIETISSALLDAEKLNDYFDDSKKEIDYYGQQSFAENMEVVMRSVDPRVIVPYFYMVATQNVIDEFLKFDNSYIEVKKEVRKFEHTLGKKTLNFEVYKIKVNEAIEEYGFEGVYFNIVLDSEGAGIVSKILMAEDDITNYKARLSLLGAIF